MKRLILFTVIFAISFLTEAQAQKKPAQGSSAAASVSAETANALPKDIAPILATIPKLKNPFLSLLPPLPPPKVEPPKPVKPVKPPVTAPPAPKPQAPKPKPNLSLKGMVWGEAAPQAIINDKIVSEGEIIDGAKVERISKKGVLLSFENDTMVLTIAQ